MTAASEMMDLIERRKAAEKKRTDAAKAGIGTKRYERTRMVPDPSMTDAELLHRVAAEMDRANLSNTVPRTDLHKVRVTGNEMTRIGALCFVQRRRPHHERAAEMFKSAYEARYGSAMAAMDAGRVQVDTSPVAHDSGMAHKIDATERIVQAESDLGKERFDRIVAVVVLGVPCGEGMHWRARKVSIDTLLDDLDALAVLWGIARGT